jgi:IclR family transcriptional regulator, pca regulon regulatory protein
VVEDNENRDHVTALARGLEVIAAFTSQNEQLTLADIAKLVKLSRATVRRYLLTLENLGYVEASGRYFRLSPRVLILAQAYLSSSLLPRVAQPFLERLSSSLDESCLVAILNGDEVIYVARSARKRMTSMVRDVGAHLPAYCTSVGRVLLSNLSEDELDRYLQRAELRAFTPLTIVDKGQLRQELAAVRQQGYSIIDQELEHGLLSLGVPLINSSGRSVAAMSVSTQVTRTGVDRLLDTYLPALRQTTVELRPLLVG